MSDHNNKHVPDSYNPLPSNFQAPAHDFNKQQVEDVIDLAERTGHENQGGAGALHSGSGATHSGPLSTGHASGVSSSTPSSGPGLSGNQGQSHLGSSSHDHHRSGHNSGLGSGTGTGAGAGLGAAASRLGSSDNDRKDIYDTSKTQQDTSNKAPNLGTDSRIHQNEINAVPGVGDAAPKMGKANVGGTNRGSFPPNNTAGSDPAATGTMESGASDEYPEQRHAGKAGLGPHYHESQGGIGSKLSGLKDKLLHKGETDQGRVERIHQQEEAAQDPLQNNVKGQTGLTGTQGHLNPDDSKGMASKRLGEDSMTLGDRNTH